MVLSGHCHVSCRTHDNHCLHLTTSAYVEPPFQVRVITLTDRALDAGVALPVELARYHPVMNEDKLWTAGNGIDRRVHLPL